MYFKSNAFVNDKHVSFIIKIKIKMYSALVNRSAILAFYAQVAL